MLVVTDAVFPEGSEVWTIVVGAGAGERMAADRPKAFVRFRGRTLLASSLKVFDDHPGHRRGRLRRCLRATRSARRS